MGTGSREYGAWRRNGDELGEPSEVLDSGDEVELVPCAGHSPQSEPGEAKVPLHVAETGLDLLAPAG